MSPSIWDRIGTGLRRLSGVPEQSSLFTPEELAAAQRRSLITMGAGLLSAQGQQFLPALGTAIPAGREAGINELQFRAATRESEMKRQMEERRRAVLAMGNPDLASSVRALLSAGDIEGALSVARTNDALSTEGQRLMQVDTGSAIELRNPISGALVLSVPQVDANSAAGQRAVQNANQMYSQFAQQTQDERKIALSYRTVLAAGSDPSPAGDMALIFAFMKMLDPGSTVREGEYANAQNAGSVPTRIRQFYNNVVDGYKLTDDQRKDFLKQAGSTARGARRGLQSVIEDYRRRAALLGVKADAVTYDYFTGLPVESDVLDKY